MINLQYPYFSIKSIVTGNVENPDTGHYSIFINSADNKLTIKDSSGNLTPLIDNSSAIFNKTFTLESPTATEDMTIFRTDVDITVQEIIAVSVGTSPSTTYQLKFSTDRNAAGTALTTSSTTTSTTTGNVATLSTAAIPANSWVWFETTAATGTDVRITIDIRYTID